MDVAEEIDDYNSHTYDRCLDCPLLGLDVLIAGSYPHIKHFL
jgi:hypothetical protein